MTSQTMSAEIVDKLGVASFIAMSVLIFICISIGMFAVYDSYRQPNWQQACIQAGGVPIQLSKSSFDCKEMAGEK